MGRLTFGVRDHCVQRGRAGSRAPIPLLGLDAVFCWLVYVSSVLRTEILENSMILTKVNEKEKLGRMSRPAVTPAVCLLRPRLSRRPGASAGPASQDSLGSLRPRLPGRPRVSQAPPPRTPSGLSGRASQDALEPLQAPPPRTPWGLSGPTPMIPWRLPRPRPQGSLGSPWPLSQDALAPPPHVCGLGWEGRAVLGWKRWSSRRAGD